MRDTSTTSNWARSPRWRALILTAGGARGAYQAGVVAALARSGLVRFDLVIGSSIGAANGAAVVMGLAGDLPDHWRENARSLRVLRPERLLSLGSPLVLRDAIRTLVTRYRDAGERIRSSPTELVLTATDFDTGELVAFSSRDSWVGEEERIERFLAATALPWIAGGPVRTGGRRCCDGAFAAHIPLGIALARGFRAEDVLVVDPGLPAPAAVLGRVFGRSVGRLGFLPLPPVRLAASLCRAYFSPPPVPGAVRVVSPSRPLGTAVLDFRIGPIERCLEIGRKDGEALVAAAVARDALATPTVAQPASDSQV